MTDTSHDTARAGSAPSRLFRSGLRLVAALVAGWTVASACSPPPKAGGTSEDGGTPPVDLEEATHGPAFVRLSTEIGLDFEHDTGWTGSRFTLETMGAGGGFFDFDNDGWIDIYLVQSGPVPWAVGEVGGEVDREVNGTGRPTNRLFRNRKDGTFEDVTASSGLDDAGYGMGACFGDIDGDGLVDVAVTNFGPNRLYRNLGDGVFEDVSSQAGFDDDRWGASCAFADYDQDGDLDLYVVNYYQYSKEIHRECGNPEFPSFCPPDYFPGDTDLLYRNRGGGRFEEVSREVGATGQDPTLSKGLGARWFDFDDDGDLDLYVANDLTPNNLYRNDDGQFAAIGMASGGALNQNGVPEASMGIDTADVDGDGWLDLLVTHFSFETNTLYRNVDGRALQDRTAATGVGTPGLLNVGFGTVFLDADNDGDEDLFVANGHISDNIEMYNPTESYRQQDQYLENEGGRFTDGSAMAGIEVSPARVGRGAATGDYDNDGDLDLLVMNNGGRAEILRNDLPRGRHWLRLDLTLASGRPAVGAKVTVQTGTRRQVKEIAAGSSYLSQSDVRLHFGLGESAEIDRVTIRWPDGSTEDHPNPGDLVDRTTSWTRTES